MTIKSLFVSGGTVVVGGEVVVGGAVTTGATVVGGGSAAGGSGGAHAASASRTHSDSAIATLRANRRDETVRILAKKCIPAYRRAQFSFTTQRDA